MKKCIYIDKSLTLQDILVETGYNMACNFNE